MTQTVPSHPVHITHIGGPTVLIEIDGLRFLTDPTFDPAGSRYPNKPAPRVKTADPTISVAELGRVDVILLSHDQHFDNLDRAGRAYLTQAGQIMTTSIGAERLEVPARGMESWETVELTTTNGLGIHVTAVPARHGPESVKAQTGAVTGWILEWAGQQHGALYISGDTVFYEDIAEIGRRYQVGTALVHFGAAHVDIYGAEPLTMNAQQGVQFAQSFDKATIIPIHYEGWSHLTEGRSEIEQAFAAEGLTQHLHFLPFGLPITINV